MAQQSHTDDAAEEQIDKKFVATTLGQVGEQYSPSPDAPEMRHFNVAHNARHRNVQRALLIDSENPDGQLRYGWTNNQRTAWKVAETGDTLEVTEVHDLKIPDDEGPVEDEQRYMQEGMDVILSELRGDVAGDTTSRSVRDQLEFVGSQRLRVDDEHGHVATFDIELTGDSDD
jgi:hypothetical protein